MIFIGGARALRILLIHTVHGLFVALMSDRSTMRQFRAVCACAHMVINGWQAFEQQRPARTSRAEQQQQQQKQGKNSIKY